MRRRTRPAMVWLASGSAIRRRLLEASGLTVQVIGHGVDEDAEMAKLAAEGVAQERWAEALARAKMDAVLAAAGDGDGAAGLDLASGDIVISADQVVLFEGEAYGKPVDEASARDRLMAWRGQSHSLVSAAVVAWSDGSAEVAQAAQVRLRSFTEAEARRYVAEAPDEALGSASAYAVEGRGVQLVSEIDGDFFVVLGLPLLPLLEVLRKIGGGSGVQKAMSE